MIADGAEMLTQAFKGRNQHSCDSEFGRNANRGVNIESRMTPNQAAERDLFTTLSNL
jgi:hypothetical protein